MQFPPFFGPLCALFSSFTWAIGTSGYARMARTHSAFTINFVRALISLPLFLLTIGLMGDFASFEAVRFSHVGWFTLAVMASYAVGDVCFLLASRSLGVPVALSIASSNPLLTALWGVFVRGERLALSQVLGLFLTVGGVICVILNAPREPVSVVDAAADQSPEKGTSLRTQGLGLAVLSMVLWAINGYAVSQGGRDLSMPVANVLRMLIAVILCGVMARVFAPQVPLLLSRLDLRRWLWVFLLEGYFGACFFTYGLSHSPLSIGPALAAVAPAISVPVALILRLERFSIGRTLGVFTVVLGLWLLVTG